MNTFQIDVPVAKGKHYADLTEEFIALVPFGEENAISRNILTQTCVAVGLVDKDIKDPDRAMRNIMQKAKLDYAICNNGNGYFRPLPKDIYTLKVCIQKERSRIISVSAGFRTLEKLYEDIIHGRIKE